MRQFLSDHRDWVIDGNCEIAAMKGRDGANPKPDYYLSQLLSLELPLCGAWKRYRRYKVESVSMAEGA